MIAYNGFEHTKVALSVGIQLMPRTNGMRQTAL